MLSKHTCLLVSALAAGALPLSAQAVRQMPAHTQSGTSDLHGHSVTQLGDWNADGKVEYAVGAPSSNAGGATSGLVRIFDGINGALLRTVSGVGGIMPCGGGGTVGDYLGYRMADVDDLDGDGLRDLLVGRPFTPVFSGVCFQPNHGGFTLIFSNAATSNFGSTAATAVNLGKSVSDIGAFAGLSFFAVGGNGRVEIWLGPNPQLFIPLTSADGYFGWSLTDAGTWGGVLPAFATRSGSDQVSVISAFGTTLQTLNGPAGSNYGESLDRLIEAGLPDALVIGAPTANGGAGMVEVVDASGIAVQIFGNAGDFLGTAVAAGGDIDNDGDEDFVASAPGGGYVLIADRQGNQAKRTITPGAAAGFFGSALDIVPDLQPDGFDEILVGDQALPQSFIYLGGPDATVTPVGLSCSQGTGFAPVLTASGDPIIGTGVSFSLAGASPNAASTLLLGVTDPVGTLIPPGPCLFHLFLVPPPVTAFSTQTSAAGGWTSPAITMPVNPGFKAGFASVTVAPVTGLPLEFSNALDLTLGW